MAVGPAQNSRFSHLTAARLRGWWLPATIAHPVFAAMLNADPRPRRPGCWSAGIPSRSR